MAVWIFLRNGDLGPGLQSFLKVKETLTLREVIFCHDNKSLIIMFRSGFVFNRLRTSPAGSLTQLFINIFMNIKCKHDLGNFTP